MRLRTRAPEHDQLSTSRFGALLLSPAARPLRVLCTSSLATLVQLSLLSALDRQRWNAVAANGVALVLSAQVSFVLSYAFTWRDRRPAMRTRRTVLSRWATYQVAMAGTALLNLLVFAAVHTVLPLLAAAVTGSAVAALGNYTLNDRLVFRAGSTAHVTPDATNRRGDP